LAPKIRVFMSELNSIFLKQCWNYPNLPKLKKMITEFISSVLWIKDKEKETSDAIFYNKYLPFRLQKQRYLNAAQETGSCMGLRLCTHSYI
jgi:hypothetical protein